MERFTIAEKADLNREDQKALFLLAQNGCHDAKERLILLNQGLVVYLVKKTGNKEEWEDLIQEGNIGLMKAIDRYDPDLGYTFSTYASWWIRQSIQHYLLRIRPLITLGKGVNQTLIQMDQTKQQMMQKLNREIKDEELAEAMDLTLERLRKIQKIAMDCGTLFIDENEKYGEMKISSSRQNDVHDEVILKQTIEVLFQAISTLSEREQKILIQHFGINGEKQQTLQEIADQMNLCKERIRQIESQALKKLKLFFK